MVAPPGLAARLRGRSGILSIDTDFFAGPGEQALAPRLAERLAGRPLNFREEHADLVPLVTRPVEFVVNVDYHLDCRVEFLHGDPAQVPPASHSVFETLLADGLVRRYVWAFPAARRATVAQVYASALLAGRQPLLDRIHPVDAETALLALADAEIESVFVCRSPAYATPATDAVYDLLRGVPA